VLYLKYYNLLKRLQQWSPTWCKRAPGGPQGPSRSPVGIGVARGSHSRQISSIFCRFVLWFCPKQNTAARWSQNIWSPTNFGLAMLPSAGLF